MCGRYGFIPPSNFKIRFELENELEDLRNRYNVAPGSYMPVITRNSPNKVELMRWGLIPFWSKDSKVAYSTINARAETVESSPAFRKPFKSQRCLIPASFFFEWKRLDKKTKIPYLFKLSNDDVFSFAGLYDVWKDAEGKELKTYTIVTTTPNKLMESIHNRMPVILDRDEEAVWLDLNSEITNLKNLLDPFETNYMTDYKISPDVNKATNDFAQIIEKVEN